MFRPALVPIGLAILVVLAGCNGLPGSRGPVAPTPATDSTSTGPPLQELENASVWVGGTVERVESNTVYIDNGQYSDVVIPVVFTDNSAPFYCQPTNDAGVGCDGMTDVSDVQGEIEGEEVCAFVEVANGTVEAGKVFFNAVCGGPKAPPQ